MTTATKAPKREKENAIPDALFVISHSWTWDKMTETEKARFMEEISGTSTAAGKALRGGYDVRYFTVLALFSAFLAGLGYTGPRWRADPDEESPLF